MRITTTITAATQSKIAPPLKFVAPLFNWLPFILPFLAALLVYNLTAADGLTWRHAGEDGGDLATAVALGGVPHPTGYPLYLMVNRLFLLLAPNPARALIIASAFWGAMAAGLSGSATTNFCRIINPAGKAVVGGIFSGLALAFAPLVWSQALIVEIYSFNLFLLALFYLTLSWWWEKPSYNKLILVALVAGLAVGQHRTALFSLPGSIWLIFIVKKPGWKQIGLLLAVFLLALFSPYLYLLFCGGNNPAANWSDIGLGNLAGLWEHLSGGDYRQYWLAAPLSQSLGRIPASFNLLLQQFGLVGLLLGWLGLMACFLEKRARPLGWLSLSGLLLYLAFAAGYAADNSQIYLLPAFQLWAILSGWSLVWAINQLPSKVSAGWGLGIALLTLLIIPGLSLITNYTKLNLSGLHEAESWATTTLKTAPEKAVLLSYHDSTTFALWYAQSVRKFRPEVAIIDVRLLDKAWYRRNLKALYPALKLVEGADNPAQIISNRPLITVTEPDIYQPNELFQP